MFVPFRVLLSCFRHTLGYYTAALADYRIVVACFGFDVSSDPDNDHWFLSGAFKTQFYKEPF